MKLLAVKVGVTRAERNHRFNIRRPIASSLFVLLLFSAALAQENLAPIETPREPAPSGPLVTAAATAKRVRFVSPGPAVQLRLEVYNETGQKLFDTKLRGGNVLDWHFQDDAGERLLSGSYACVLTIKSLSGRLSQRVGLATVNGTKAAIAASGADQLSIAQQQTIGPVGGNASFTVLQESETEAITTVTHDGSDGQVARTSGALSFRVGDFFFGNDNEQMRLTADGRLGIGTSDPQASLDVAGTIRAERVLIARPGKPGNKMPAGDTAQAMDAEPAAQPLASGSGTQNRLAKWIDDIGTLGDSGITENAVGLIGIGTTNPQTLLQVGANPGYGSTHGLLIANNLLGSQFDRAFQLAPRQTASPASNSILMYTLPTVNFGVTVPNQFGLFVDGRQGTGSITSYAAIATGQTASLGATNNTHLMMGNLAIPAGNFAIFDNTGHKSFFKGNVGIGTSSPAAKLDVVGDINTSTQFNIGGQRVLTSAAGQTTDNVFAGVFAGQSSLNTGTDNSFFGVAAGGTNTTGSFNSFVGRAAGFQNKEGSSNVFVGNEAGNFNDDGNNNTIVGAEADVSNANLTNATAIGYRAKVSQSNSLILGSNIVGGGTKVGIDTTAPTHFLTVGEPETPVIANALTGVYGSDRAYSIVRDKTNNVEGLFGADANGVLYGAMTDHHVKFRTNNTTRVTIFNDGSVEIGQTADRGKNLFVHGQISFHQADGGEVGLCATQGNDVNLIATCGSSIRYKTDVRGFTPGLDLLSRLRPVSFRWKTSGHADLGLVAEEVERVEPLLVTYNKQGGVEGVKYDRIGVVLLNAVQEQQAQIKMQQQQLQAKDARITNLEARLTRYDARLASLDQRLRRGRTAHHAKRRSRR